MKILCRTAFATLFAGMLAPLSVAADPMADICHERARSASGFSGSPSGLTRKVGNTTFSLSGSVAIGAGRSSGTQPARNAPPFAGQAASEQREDKQKDKYQRIYDNCMRSR